MITLQERRLAVELIDEARKAGARLEPACKLLGIDERTYQRWTESGAVSKDKRTVTENRPAPSNKLTKEERSKVIEVVNFPEYANLPPCKIVPRLADEGEYIASESTFYRILREEKMNTHRIRSNEPVKRIVPTHVATGPNQVWTWDITWLNASIKGQYYKLYLIVDLFSRFIVGYEVWETENSVHAETLVKKATLSQGTRGKPLVLHSDNGSPMKAATFLATLEKLGVHSSFSRPRVSNDNPYSESLFNTMKYCPEYPSNGFESLEVSRKWVYRFVKWYNYLHCHSGINFITPYQRHYGLDKEILENRKKVYTEAMAKNPSRWSKGKIRDWSLPEYVALNPTNNEEVMHVTKELH